MNENLNVKIVDICTDSNHGGENVPFEKMTPYTCSVMCNIPYVMQHINPSLHEILHIYNLNLVRDGSKYLFDVTYSTAKTQLSETLNQGKQMFSIFFYRNITTIN